MVGRFFQRSPAQTEFPLQSVGKRSNAGPLFFRCLSEGGGSPAAGTGSAPQHFPSHQTDAKRGKVNNYQSLDVNPPSH